MAETEMTESFVAVQQAPPPLSFGRRPIYTKYDRVTPENVREVVVNALLVHNQNRSEIQALYDIYRGKQAILQRQKDIRPEICNYVVVNRANEIVSFKSSYILGEPLQYVSSSKDKKDVVDKLTELNEFMRLEGKAAKDIELANWFHICGVAYRLVLPDSRSKDPHGSPFNLYTLDPRDTFVVRYSGVSRHVVAGVHIVRRKDEPDLLCVYTPEWYMEFDNADEGAVPPTMRAEPVSYVDVPIVEYLHNQVRLGAFEVVLSQLNEINTIESNRVDAIEQVVQSLMVFENCDFDDGMLPQMRRNGAIKIKSTSGIAAKVYAVENTLDQSGAQTTVDDLQASIYDICGMPATQNGGASTSDTGSAVILRDGWQQAEARAKETEKYFEASEYKMLELVLDICRNTRNLDIYISDLKPQFTRRNYADLLTKSQVLTTMLSNQKIAPILAFEACGMFPDPGAAYQQSLPYIEEAKASMTAEKQPTDDGGDNAENNGDRSGQPGTERS